MLAVSTAAALLLLSTTQASKYTLDYVASDHTYTEGNMYATDEGPFGHDGESSIITELVAHSRGKGGTLVVTAYHAVSSPIEETDDIVDAICADVVTLSTAAFESKMAQHGMDAAVRSIYPLTSQAVRINTRYVVRERGLQYARITQCPRMSDEVVHIEGSLRFKNPYGYLAGELYPLLPFESLVC
jgi:hypothetical protein